MKKYLVILSIILIIVLGVDATKRFSQAHAPVIGVPEGYNVLSIKQETEGNKEGKFTYRINVKGWETILEDEVTSISSGSVRLKNENDINRSKLMSLGEKYDGTVFEVRYLQDGIPVTFCDNKNAWGLTYEYRGAAFYDDGATYFETHPEWMGGTYYDSCAMVQFTSPIQTASFQVYMSMDLSDYGNMPDIEENNDEIPENDIYEFTLKNNDTKLIPIPEGYEYEIQQLTPEGWELVSINGSEEPTNTSGTMDNNITYTFLNRKTVNDEPEEPIVEPEVPQEPEPTEPTPNEPTPTEPVNPVKEDKPNTSKTNNVVPRSTTPNTVDKIIIDVELLTISMLVMGICIMLIRRTR